MNRPSRTDDDFDHPTWNQNPPFLAPDLTTCQDMNGIANTRQFNSATGSMGTVVGVDEATVGFFFGEQKQVEGIACVGFPIKAKMIPRSLQKHLCRPVGDGDGSSVLSWAMWIISILVTSFAISSFNAPKNYKHVEGGELAADDLIRSAHALSRRDVCETGGVTGDYNTPLHVGALLIILAVSGLACAFPVIATRLPKLRIPDNFFFAVRHFGTGVLIATAFVHLLPTAFISLGDPCLTGFWTEKYPAMPGAIALAGIFLVAIIEMIFSPARQLSNGHVPNALAGTAALPGDRTEMNVEMNGTENNNDVIVDAELGNVRGRRDSISRQLTRLGDSKETAEPKHPQYSLPKGESADQEVKKQILQCMMLEVGILFHSVFIGMALSVAIGRDFVVLLVAIAFHQSFEGLALGARIASIPWAPGSYRPWFMALAYGLTTPIGQAIGIATHSLYDPFSAFGLTLVGTMNAISAGLLVYASLVELLSEDFLSDESWRILRGKRRIAACLLVFAGAFGMSLIGAWA